MVATGNASYSGMVFGLFTMLGCNFLSRFKDLNDQRFWRVQMPGCGDRWLWTARGLARNEVNLNKVTAHWPDMLRTPASLVTGRIRAHNLLRGFGCVTRRAPLGQAFTEYGRIAKTLNLRPDHAGIGRYDLHPGDRLAFAGDALHSYRTHPEVSELKEIPGLSRPCSRNSKGALEGSNSHKRASRQRRAVSWSGAPGVFQGLRRRIAVGCLGHGVGGLVCPGSGRAAQRAECRSDEEVDLCLGLVRRGR